MKQYRILAKDVYRNNNTWETQLNNNDLIIGPSGSGKTRGYVIPNILQSNESMVVADTKGDLFDKLTPYLRKKGYKIYHIDFKNFKSTHGYNPLDSIGYNVLSGKYNEKDIQTIAHDLVPENPGEREPFWTRTARSLLKIYIAYTLETKDKSKHHLGEVGRIFSRYDVESFHRKMIELFKENPESYAFQLYSLYQSTVKSPVTDASIRANVAERINELMMDGLINMYTNHHKLDIKSLGDRKSVVFLSISDIDRSQDRLISIFYKQTFQILTEHADSKNKSQLEIPVRFILDDFATNAYIEEFDNIISVIRSREIYVSIIIQSLTQLDKLYDVHGSTTITNNCDTWIYLGGQDIKTAEVIAKKTNIPMINILELPIETSYLFTRGEQAKKVDKFNLEKHREYNSYIESQIEKENIITNNSNQIFDDLPF